LRESRGCPIEEREISGDAIIYYHDRPFSFLFASMSEVPLGIQRLLRRLITSLPNLLLGKAQIDHKITFSVLKILMMTS
jgi:hypothetical protein